MKRDSQSVGTRRRATTESPSPSRVVTGFRQWWTGITAESASRPVVTAGNARGALWIAFIAVEYYLLSNPLVFVPAFEASLSQAFGLALVVALTQAGRLRAPVISWPIVLFLAFASLSMLWGISADDTWATTRLYVLIAVLAVMVASNCSSRVITYGFAFGGVIIVLTSLYAHVKHLPGAEIPLGATGYMAGVGTNRNILAYSLVPALSACLAAWPRARVEWLLIPVLAAVNGWGIYVAQSGTGYISVMCVVATAVVLRIGLLIRPWLGRRVIWAIQLMALATVGTIVLFFDRIASAVGRDGRTLSGRVPLWEGVVRGLDSHSVAGLGWGAVWPHPWQTADPNTFTTELFTNLGTVYTHGHNSFMDVLPQLGWIGVALLAWCYLDLIARSARRMWNQFWRRAESDGAIFILVTAAGHLAFGATEPMAVIPMGWFILVIIASLAASTPRQLPVDASEAAREGRAGVG
jgi:hypothetical protein